MDEKLKKTFLDLKRKYSDRCGELLPVLESAVGADEYAKTKAEIGFQSGLSTGYEEFITVLSGNFTPESIRHHFENFSDYHTKQGRACDEKKKSAQSPDEYALLHAEAALHYGQSQAHDDGLRILEENGVIPVKAKQVLKTYTKSYAQFLCEEGPA